MTRRANPAMANLVLYLFNRYSSSMGIAVGSIPTVIYAGISKLSLPSFLPHLSAPWPIIPSVTQQHKKGTKNLRVKISI